MTTDHEASMSIFTLLQSQVPALNSMNVRPTEVITDDGPVVHAVDGSGFPTLLVPVPLTTDTYVDWENRSVTFGYRTIEFDGGTGVFLALQCKLEKLLPQFALLVDDILDSIAEEPDNANLITRKTVDRWREMLKDSRQQLLSESQLSGLFGELLFLDRVTGLHGGLALEAWTGPQGNRHDFEFVNASFEVKTTSNHNNMVVSFHGTRQLEHTQEVPLFVLAHQIERIPGGDSVPTLLNRLYNSGIDRFELLRKLSDVGYSEADATHYTSTTFSVISSRTFLVDTNFPRITHETLTHQDFLEKISSLQYSVDLGHLDETIFDLQDLELASS